MWDQLENILFLTLFFGVPVAFVVLFIVAIVRSVTSPRRPGLAQNAKERGWKDTTDSGFRFRFQGSIDGLPFVFAAPRIRGRSGHRRSQAEVRIPFEAPPGAFVVQHEIPELALSLVSTLGGALLDVLRRDEMADALRSLARLDAKGHGRYVAYATPEAHRDAPHTEALARVLSDLDPRAPTGVVLYTWDGELVLLVHSQELETTELVDVAARCHRALTSDPGTPTSYR
ncbi:MAG: hypothetical protein U0353_19100 [Sandaracinus sp.]